MIELSNITKHFDDKCALNRVSASFKEGAVSVITGTSGSGKSTLIRIIGGIIRPDSGVVIVDDMPIYDNVTTQKRLFVLPEKPYCPSYESASELAHFYGSMYDGFSEDVLKQLSDRYDLPLKGRMRGLHPDARALMMLAMGISASTAYLVCDDMFTAMDRDVRTMACEMISEARRDMGTTFVVAVSDPSLLGDLPDYTYELETVRG